VFWLSSLGMQFVQVLGPDGLETVLTNRDQAFSNKLGWDYLIAPFFDRGVMLMDLEEHRHHRRIMQQAFKRERLVAYLEKMNSAIERGVRRWSSTGVWHLYRATKQLTLDVATEVFEMVRPAPRPTASTRRSSTRWSEGRRSSAPTRRPDGIRISLMNS
jgi:cytochrome P450